MLYQLFTHMEMATPEEVERLLPLVPAWRREEALRFSHTFGRYCCLKSWLMVEELVAAVSPTLEAGFEVARNEYGKPYIVGREDVCFSISHTKNAILVVLADRPIGCDVEALRTPSEGLVDKTMNEEEQACVAQDAEQFTALWTQKEAVLKQRGTGIVDDLHDVLSAARKDGITTETHRTPGFYYSFAI